MPYDEHHVKFGIGFISPATSGVYGRDMASARTLPKGRGSGLQAGLPVAVIFQPVQEEFPPPQGKRIQFPGIDKRPDIRPGFIPIDGTDLLF